MDVAYTRHATEARRKNRSQTSLNHLTLAPLTSKFPITDPDDLPDFTTTTTSPIHHNPSYLQGKSAPATPRLLSRSPARTRTSSPRRRSLSAQGGARLPKSKSASHLHGLDAFAPAAPRRRGGHRGHHSARDHQNNNSISNGDDSDWLLHAGAFISTETRERKGQAWLISRASTTSLTGARDTEEEAYERELARERELASRRGSRRGSLNLAEDEDIAMTTPGYARLESRSHSRTGSTKVLFPRTPLRTPLKTTAAAAERDEERGYFAPHSPQEEAVSPGAAAPPVPGPDFVGLDEKLEAIDGDGGRADEAAVRRLLRGDRAGMGGWMGSLLGWSLFAVEENDEESDDEEYDGDSLDGATDKTYLSRTTSTRSFTGISDVPKEPVPPPKADQGGWHDAAWLLSVASKVLL